MLNSNKYTIVFISWMVMITLLSFFSFSGVDDEISFPYMDKLVHFVFYSVAAITLGFALRERSSGKMRLSNALLISFLFSLVFGIIIEVLQSTYTSWRSGELADVIANTIGALTGTAFLKLLFSGNRQLKWKI
ncbi:VanZ like protein [Zeaxanthinibacter enoshimensis]|uniref:VanZ like protein n=1 Tax=Zeaxanthinibacter enoshimensis TaxID=392009 RepID=A0A4V3D3Y8_9FLAO|nr:VanZ like protein [Zeaxanthinibacter enoshimensis]